VSISSSNDFAVSFHVVALTFTLRTAKGSRVSTTSLSRERRWVGDLDLELRVVEGKHSASASFTTATA
jgi:hypothetical protein